MEKAEPIFVYLLLRSKEKRRGQWLPDNKKSEVKEKLEEE